MAIGSKDEGVLLDAGLPVSDVEAALQAHGQPATPYMRIEPSKGWVSLKLDELWEYRELVYFLIWRDIKVRYKQTVIGAAWAIIQPFFTMIVFTIVFGGIARMPSDGIPYPIFSYAALVPWTFFASGLGNSSNSLVGSASLITKVYFPRLVIPITNVASGIVDFGLAFLLLLGMMVFYGIAPTINVVWLPLLLLLAFVTSLGVGTMTMRMFMSCLIWLVCCSVNKTEACGQCNPALAWPVRKKNS